MGLTWTFLKKEETQWRHKHTWEVQGPDCGWEMNLQNRGSSIYVLLQNSLGIPDLFKVTGITGFTFTNAAFPLSEPFWNVYMKKRKKNLAYSEKPEIGAMAMNWRFASKISSWKCVTEIISLKPH